jgi:putative transcriptional regulator
MNKMMSTDIKHHLTDEILMGYSAGTLPEAFNLMVATHVSLCDACRAQLAACDAVGGVLLDEHDIPNTQMQPDSFAATMAMIEQSAPIRKTPAPKKSSVLPTPLQDYIGGDLSEVKWRPIGMGVKQAILPTSKQASARLLMIPAGAAMPDHGHHGLEMTMVLQGAFQDDDGYFARGDVDIADSDLEHTPMADIHEDCICLAVSDAPLRFKGILPRIMQSFIRI